MNNWAKKVFIVTCIFYAIVIFTMLLLSLNGQIKLRNELILTLLVPQLQATADAFYVDYLSELPSISYYQSKIISLKKYDNGFYIKVGTLPYVVAHNPVGYDLTEFLINFGGEVTLLQFTHKQNFDLPDHIKNIVIKPIPIQ